MTQKPSTSKPRARDPIDGALEELHEALAVGQSEAMTAFLDCMSRLHKYSYGNVLLIASQMPTATRVAGFRAWKKLGRHVKKGERGLKIVVPMKRRKGEDDEDTPVFFKVGHVFDASQTTGDPLPEPPRLTGDPRENLDRLHEFAADRKIEIERHDFLAPGTLGVSCGGRIKLLSNLPPAREFEILAHEIAHEILHQSLPIDERPSKTVKETEAEAVAYTVARAIGLEGAAASSDYILSYDGDIETLKGSLERIRTTSHEILSALGASEEVTA